MELIDYKNAGGILTIFLRDHIDSANAAKTEQEITEVVKNEKFDNIIVNCSSLHYISSAGLRVILRLRKDYPNIEVVEVSPEVYEIFDMTGFTEMMRVRRAFRRISVEGCEVIGEGANGKVYRIDPDTIVKYYRDPNSLGAIERERELARKAFVKGIPTAIPYDVVRVGDGYGSVFELLNAESFAKILIREPERLDEIIDLSVDLLKKLHSTELAHGDMPDCRDVAMEWLEVERGDLPAAYYDKLHHMLSAMPEDNHMIHGDFHLKNVMMQNGEVLLIDMDTLCLGNRVFEFMSVFNAYMGYAELDHSVTMSFLGIPYETGKEIWEKLLRRYLGTENEKKINKFADKARLLGYARILKRWSSRKQKGKNYNQAEIDNCILRIGELLETVDSLT